MSSASVEEAMEDRLPRNVETDADRREGSARALYRRAAAVPWEELPEETREAFRRLSDAAITGRWQCSSCGAVHDLDVVAAAG